MPGIHVHTLSQFNWLDQGEKSLLTIPGSYWLCYKKNIYKFIFRYHRAVKNTLHFSYGRELFKIIRRIIKCHPTQGQQFGTQHLLVTYNCTSWTRQDKMFAILKFQQRTNAAAFSHAFVLTIKMCPSSEQPLFNLKYPIVKEAEVGAGFEDLNISLNPEEKINKTVIYGTNKMSLKKTAIDQSKKIEQVSKHNTSENTLNKTSETSIICNKQDFINKSANFYEHLDANVKNTTDNKHIINKLNIEFHNDIYKNNSMDNNTKTLEEKSKHHIDGTPFRTIKDIDGIKKEVCIDQETKSNDYQESQSIKKNFSSSKSLMSGTIKNDVDEWPLSDRCRIIEISLEKSNVSAIDNKNNLKNHTAVVNEMIIDSNNVPYQYFIEKEIEDAKQNVKSDILSSDIGKSIQGNLQRQNTSEVMNINEDSSSKIIKKNNHDSIQIERRDEIAEIKSQYEDVKCTSLLVKANDNQAQSNIYSKSYKNERLKQKNRESDKKIMLDDKVLRSSNITDLVMEGLMFTIRQDEDSVTVIEQKTKSEVDEVLENSEKVETKAGEKCLLNSSLLRLENLITMIDSSYDKNQQHKFDHMISNKVSSSLFKTSANDSVYNLNINDYVNRKADVSSTISHDKQNVDQLNPCTSQWQHQDTSTSVTNINNCSASINTKREQLREWKDSDHKQKKIKDVHRSDIEITKEKRTDYSKVEEDIPEGFQSAMFSSEEKDTELQNMDIDIEEPVKYDTYTRLKKNHRSKLSQFLPSSSKISTDQEKSEIKQESNVPKIVSNKAITVEQMPLALQKVLRYTYRRRKLSSTVNSDSNLQTELRTKGTTTVKDIISEVDVRSEKRVDSSIASNSLPIKIPADFLETKNNKDVSSVISDKNDPDIDGNIYKKNMKGHDNEIHRSLRRSTSLKHNGSSIKLQDITEDFYNDLMYAYNKNNAIQQRCLRQRRKFLNNSDDIKNGKMRIEMLKFIQDITEGAKVVVKRLNLDKRSLLGKESTLTTCMH